MKANDTIGFLNQMVNDGKSDGKQIVNAEGGVDQKEIEFIMKSPNG